MRHALYADAGGTAKVLTNGEHDQYLVQFDKAELGPEDFAKLAVAMNKATVITRTGKTKSLLKEGCLAQVIDGSFGVMDRRSTTPNPVIIARPGPTEEVLEKIADDLPETELLVDNVILMTT